MFKKLIWKLVKYGASYEEERMNQTFRNNTGALRGPATGGYAEMETDSLSTSELQRRILDQENKFMTLCSHLGVYITRPNPGPLFEVKDLNAMKGGIAGAAETAAYPTQNAAKGKK